jgi:hypothetical protein
MGWVTFWANFGIRWAIFRQHLLTLITGCRRSWKRSNLVFRFFFREKKLFQNFFFVADALNCELILALRVFVLECAGLPDFTCYNIPKTFF